MASSINASTSGPGGVITTADNSGILNLQSGGTTVATVGPSGLSTPAASTINTANTFGFKNRIINGGMTISQRGTSFTGLSTDGTYTLDRWFYAMNGGGAVSSTQSSTAPAGFINSILTTVTTASGSLGSSAYYQLRQAIEGLNISDLGWGTANAKAVTVSFWVQSSVTGTYSFCLRNSAASLSYVATYSIPVANTWTQISITIPGPTTATWLTTNGIGIFATWDFGTGSGAGVTSTANTWLSGNYIELSGTTQLINTNGATFYLTGVQLEVGSQATSFDFRSIGTELALCQRYYYQTTGNRTGTNGPFAIGFFNVNSGNSCGFAPFPVTMRAAPSVTTYVGPNANQVALIGGGTGTGTSVNNITTIGFAGMTGTNMVGVGGIQFDFNASAEL